MKGTKQQKDLSKINDLVGRMFEDLYSRSTHQCERLFNSHYDQATNKSAFLAEADRYANDQFTNPIPIYNEEMLHEIVRIVELKYKEDPTLLTDTPSPDQQDRCYKIVDQLGVPAMNSMGEEEYISASEVADFLGLSVNTIYTYNHERKIPFYKKENGKPRYKLSEIIKWVESEKIKTRSELRRDQGLE